MASQVKIIEKINEFCNKTIFVLKDFANGDNDTEYQWTYYNSFFFALTTLSTIGYGNLHPSTSLGRIMVILYALIGIPLNGIVLTKLGELFSSTFLTVHHRYKAERYESRFEMTIDITLYLIPGIVLFIFVPSIILVYFEGWSFDESIYFAFVTLTTIGYGDLVAGQTTNTKKFYGVYKVFLVFWIMIGLGYLVMILGFISRAMRCQQMTKIEQKLTQNLRLTQSKVWNEFMKDITYVRRMLNEMYLIKIRPVYKEHAQVLRGRSRSCPNLTEWPTLRKVLETEISSAPSLDEEEMQKQFQNQRMKRRTGVAENIIKPKVLKTSSESDLSNIDRVATFGTSSVMEPNELLARVVDALGTTCGLSSVSPSSSKSSLSSLEGDEYLNKKYENGIHGFTDEEILASERFQPSNRTFYNLPMAHMRNPQWTWAGPPNPLANKHNSYRKKRNNSIRPDEKSHLAVPHVRGLRRMSVAAINFISQSASKTHTWFCNNSRKSSICDPESGKPSKEKSHKSTSNNEHRFSLPSENYGSMNTHENLFGRRASILGVLADQIGPRRGYLSNENISNPVLENTTLSDFLRILDSVQAKNPTHSTLRGETCRIENEIQDRQPSALISLFQNNQKDSHIPMQVKQDLPKTTKAPITSPQPITFCLQQPTPRKRRLSVSPMSVNWYPNIVTPRHRRASLAFVTNTPTMGVSTLPTLYQGNRKRSKSSSNIDYPPSNSPPETSTVPENSAVQPTVLTPPKIYVVTPGKTSRRIRRFSVRQCDEQNVPSPHFSQKKTE